MEAKIIDTDMAEVKVVQLGGAFAVAERRYGKWSVAGGGNAGEGGKWQHESLERLARDIAGEQARHGHIAVHPTAQDAADTCGATVEA